VKAQRSASDLTPVPAMSAIWRRRRRLATRVGWRSSAGARRRAGATDTLSRCVINDHLFTECLTFPGDILPRRRVSFYAQPYLINFILFYFFQGF